MQFDRQVLRHPDENQPRDSVTDSHVEITIWRTVLQYHANEPAIVGIHNVWERAHSVIQSHPVDSDDESKVPGRNRESKPRAHLALRVAINDAVTDASQFDSRTLRTGD